MTGLIIGSAVVLAAVLGAVGWVLWGAGQLTRLQRELTGWQLDEAMRKVSGQDMEAIVDATREPPPLSDGQADRLWRPVQDGGGAVIACCPSCGTELHANGDGWWCPAEELGFSAAELIGAGL